ncbi:MAG: site-specific integrase [Leptospiraceae bacterium]|nr:site-specific integrase [Leptospiraceae bacterium]
MDIFSKEEIQKIIHFYDSQNKSIWFKMLYAFGLSLNELTDIQVRHINLKKRTITIEGKFHKRRILPIPNALFDDLKTLILNKNENDYVFQGRHGKLNTRTIQKALEKVYHSLGILVTIKKLRNTLIYDLYKSGWDDKSIAFQLGHSTVRATRKVLNALSPLLKKVHPLDKISRLKVK